ncbi:hypothetical protein [Pseudomonas arsenicoxydans]|uniref:Uncharacterized protein n=1 Tax=Pseudomonas arsenicoxydans TaxID=702115 RepID=A0A502GNS9_9PSED|nr:hypothetical protein [Pseudomonas arsenicoxydans]TPG63534.1 hypothetical protein EAH78_32075 [Pseudomonas arsenicoxydans]
MSKHQSPHCMGPNSYALGFFPLKNGAVRVVDMASKTSYEVVFPEGVEQAVDVIEKYGAYYSALSPEQREAYHNSVVCFVRYFFERPNDVWKLPVIEHDVQNALWSFAQVLP